MADLREQLQQTLGSTYTLERELGGGGMSRVFVANEMRLDRKVVIKVLSPDLAAGLSAERFEREILVAAKLQQANIVPVLSAGDSNGLPYFTMPYVAGESLRKRLASGTPLSVTEIVRILGDVARALAYAHENGIVHRDIKPDNVLLSGGTAVVTDYGIARAISASRTGGAGATLTQAGTSIGTPGYMAPEQAAGEADVDQRADIYAFGCMAYELIAGKPPFEGPAHQVLAAHIGRTPVPVDQLQSAVPPALAALVMQCLAKNVEERPAGASELTRVLDTVSSGSGSTVTPGVVGPVMFRRALVIWAAAFAGVVIAAQLAETALGLPDWVLPGAMLVMLAGLPVIMLTAYVHRAANRVAVTRTPGGSPQQAGTLANMAARALPLMSWRRTTLGGVGAVALFVVLVAGFMILRALGIGPFGSLIAAGKLDAREPLLVADFQTNAADSALSRVLAEAVRTNLSESRVISLVPAGEVAAGLQRMRVSPDTTLSAGLARDLAQREGIKAYVAGTVAPLSSGYVISAQLVEAQTGDKLASAQETVAGATDLIDATDRLARRLRERIGESLKDVRSNAPLAQVTTSSLDALKKYAEGVRANDVEGDYAKATRLLGEAIALDSMFGAAYRKLGTAMGNNGVPAAQRRGLYDKAYELRDRMTERERLLATAGYFASGTHPDRRQAVDAYQSLIDRYPDEGPALQNLAQLASARHEFARSESLYLRRIEVDSTQQFAPFNVVISQLSQGKIDAARASLTRAQRLFPTHDRVPHSKALVDYVTGDFDSFATVIDSMTRAGSPAQAPIPLWDQLVDARRLQGRFREAHDLLRASRRANAGSAGSALSDSIVNAAVALWFHDRPDEMVRRLDATLRLMPLSGLPPGQRQYPSLIRAFAAAGKTDRAREFLRNYEATLSDTVLRRLNKWQLDLARARIAAAEGRYREAIELFRASNMLPDGPRNQCQTCEDAEIGLAFDRAEMVDSTIHVYEHFVNTPDPWDLNEKTWSLARVLRRLGELHEAKGNRAEAVRYYQRFVDLWKNADPELQKYVTEIRQRLARLGDIEKR
jgi:eukaryotic-like serine/threonine-protein kinase